MICKRHAFYSALSILLLLLAAGPARGISFETSENVHISNLHRIDDDLIAWGSNITVDGLIEGDLITGGYTVNTNGHTRGSENVFAFKYHHTGKIDGALRAFANLTELDGYVGRSVLVAGNDIRIGEKAVIEKDVVLRGGQVHFNGLAKGNADISAKTIYIGGIISGDALLAGDEINITAPTVIKGDLVYVSETEAKLNLSSGVTILGETTWRLPDEDCDGNVGIITSGVIGTAKLLAAFLFGVILLFLFKKYALEAVNQLRGRLAVATATGLLSLIIFAISVVILVISVTFVLVGLALVYGEGAPVGALVLSLSILMIPITSFITVSGGVLFYSGKIIIGLVVGYTAVRLVKRNAAYLSKSQLLVGLIITTAVFSIPYIGPLLYVVISIIGAGAIVLGIKHCRRELNQSQPLSETESGPPVEGI